jgi:hypothetical protein
VTAGLDSQRIELAEKTQKVHDCLPLDGITKLEINSLHGAQPFFLAPARKSAQVISRQYFLDLI